MGALRAPLSLQQYRSDESTWIHSRVNICKFAFNSQLYRGTLVLPEAPSQGHLRFMGERGSHRFWAYFSRGCMYGCCQSASSPFPSPLQPAELSPGRICCHGNSILPRSLAFFGSLNPSTLILVVEITDKLKMMSPLNEMEGHFGALALALQ